EQNRAGTASACLLDELQSVRAEAGDGDERMAGPDLTAVHHQAGDAQIAGDAGDVGEQFAQEHGAAHCVPPFTGAGRVASAKGAAAEASGRTGPSSPRSSLACCALFCAAI